MTLNQVIKKLLKPIAEDHLQINDFGFGDLDKYATSGTIKYPIAWVLVNNIPLEKSEMNFNLSLVFADLIKDDESNTLEVQSDMIEVAADFAAKIIYHNNENIEADTSFTLKPFTERFQDLTAGVVMDITIKVTRALSDCNVPSKSII